MDKALIIIDMQDEFDTAHHKPTVKHVCKLIRQFKKQGWPIVVVEYNDFGDTLDPICEAIGNYELQEWVLKDDNDGSREVKDALKCNKWKPKSLTVCGVNIRFCVSATAIGLSKLFPRKHIVVSKLGCNDAISARSPRRWNNCYVDEMLGRSNVAVSKEI